MLKAKIFLDDPSIEKISETGHDLSDEGDVSIGYHIGHEQYAQYPIDRYASYSKVSNKFKCFIPAMANNVIPKSLVNAQCDPKWVRAMQKK